MEVVAAAMTDIIITTITIMAIAAAVVVVIAIEKSEEITETIARVADTIENEAAVVAIEIGAVIDGLHHRMQDPAKIETLNPAAPAAALTPVVIAAIESIDVILTNLWKKKRCH